MTEAETLAHTRLANDASAFADAAAPLFAVAGWTWRDATVPPTAEAIWSTALALVTAVADHMDANRDVMFYYATGGRIMVVGVRQGVRSLDVEYKFSLDIVR